MCPIEGENYLGAFMLFDSMLSRRTGGPLGRRCVVVSHAAT